MAKKIILITGASSGFGYKTAEMLLDSGKWVVYAAARGVDKMKALEQKGANLLKMDVTSDKDVNKGVETIISKEGQIDALLANAGYGSYGTIESIPLEEAQYQYEVNVFGAIRTIQAVLPHMREKRTGRIVLTTSLVAHLSFAGAGWYASSKHALKALSVSLRQEVKDLGIKVIMVEPGPVNTGFEENAMESLKKVPHQEDYQDLVKGVIALNQNFFKKAPGPEYTAKILVKALTAKNPSFTYHGTKDVGPMKFFGHLVSEKLYDKLMLTMLKKAAKSSG